MERKGRLSVSRCIYYSERMERGGMGREGREGMEGGEIYNCMWVNGLL